MPIDIVWSASFFSPSVRGAGDTFYYNNIIMTLHNNIVVDETGDLGEKKKREFMISKPAYHAVFTTHTAVCMGTELMGFNCTHTRHSIKTHQHRQRHQTGSRSICLHVYTCVRDAFFVGIHFIIILLSFFPQPPPPWSMIPFLAQTAPTHTRSPYFSRFFHVCPGTSATRVYLYFSRRHYTRTNDPPAADSTVSYTSINLYMYIIKYSYRWFVTMYFDHTGRTDEAAAAECFTLRTGTTQAYFILCSVHDENIYTRVRSALLWGVFIINTGARIVGRVMK